MSRDEDIALIERAYALWKEGDSEGVLALCADDVEWLPPANMPEPAPRVGKDALRAGIASYLEVFEEFWPEAEEVLDAGRPGAYLVLAKTHTRGRGSGAEVTIDVAHLIEIRGGLIVSLRVFAERSQGFAAIGQEAQP